MPTEYEQNQQLLLNVASNCSAHHADFDLTGSQKKEKKLSYACFFLDMVFVKNGCVQRARTLWS